MKTILITGINGYLGSELAKKYDKEYNVIGLEYTLENLFRINKKNYKVYSSKNGITNLGSSLSSDSFLGIILLTNFAKYGA